MVAAQGPLHTMCTAVDTVMQVRLLQVYAPLHVSHSWPFQSSLLQHNLVLSGPFFRTAIKESLGL